jgi:hypothetical protein
MRLHSSASERMRNAAQVFDEGSAGRRDAMSEMYCGAFRGAEGCGLVPEGRTAWRA